MKKKKITLELLDQIERDRDFEQLETYRDPKLWATIKEQERLKLARLFIKQGETLFSQNNSSPLHPYDIAVLVAPGSASILYQHCIAHLAHRRRGGDLEKAFASFKSALALDPTFEWMHDSFSQHSPFQDSQEAWSATLQEILDLFSSLQEVNFPKFYWQWALFLQEMGRSSGEPSDYYQAIQKYKLAIKCGGFSSSLYFDYAVALADLGALLHEKAWVVESLDCFKKSIADGAAYHPHYHLELCKAYVCYYQLAHEDTILEKALTAFAEGSKSCYEKPAFWLNWGLLLKEAGRVKRNLTFLEDSFDKFDKAAKQTTLVESVLVDWAEALLLAGVHSENVDYLREGHEKLSYALMFIPEEPRLWMLLGSVLNELANYFQDPSYLFEAIDKFQQGLLLSNTNYHMWWGLASSYLSLGELHQDIGCLEKSCRLFGQVIEHFPAGTPEFWNEWGLALLRVGEFQLDKVAVEQAVERFDQAIRQHLQTQNASTIEPEWVYNLGCSLDFLGDLTLDPLYYEQAVQILTKVMILDPDFPYCKYQLALAFTHLGEIASDLEAFSQALELFESIVLQDPEDDFVWNDWAVALIHYAELMREPSHPIQNREYYTQAEDKLKMALSLGNLHAHYNLACLYSLRGELTLSLEQLKKAYSSNAMPLIEDLMEDDWLENLRQFETFHQFIDDVRRSKEVK